MRSFRAGIMSALLIACTAAAAAFDGSPIDQARKLIEKKKYAEAVVALDEAVKGDPHDEALVASALEAKVRAGGLWMRKGTRAFSDTNRGLELLREMARAARPPFDELAAFEIATSHLEMRDFDEAEASFRSFGTDYPLSARGDEAAFLRARSVQLKTLKTRNPGMTALQAAREGFETYLAAGGARVAESLAAIAELRELQAVQLRRLAEFYRRRGEAEAARIYLDRLRGEFADTKAARSRG